MGVMVRFGISIRFRVRVVFRVRFRVRLKVRDEVKVKVKYGLTSETTSSCMSCVLAPARQALGHQRPHNPCTKQLAASSGPLGHQSHHHPCASHVHDPATSPRQPQGTAQAPGHRSRARAATSHSTAPSGLCMCLGVTSQSIRVRNIRGTSAHISPQP